MPELPEVETVVRSLRPLLTGRRIVSVEFPAARTAREWPATLRRLLDQPPRQLRERLAGARIADVVRYGKNIVLSLENMDGKRQARALWIHLGMTGRLTSETDGAPHSRHTHVIFRLDRDANRAGDWLHFTDLRRFGRVRLADRPAPGTEALGPEPLEIGEEEFTARLRARKAMVKALLLDQRFLRGLGNIYADESLFRAGIHPAKIAAQIGPKRALALRGAIREVLQEAIAAGGSSISDYVDGQGRPGWFQIHHHVYQRTGEPCHACSTPIRRVVVAGRNSHFCPHCQPGHKPRSMPRSRRATSHLASHRGAAKKGSG